jgi:hypothetical protein
LKKFWWTLLLEKKKKLRQFWVFLPENLSACKSKKFKKNTKFQAFSISISGDTEVLRFLHPPVSPSILSIFA